MYYLQIMKGIVFTFANAKDVSSGQWHKLLLFRETVKTGNIKFSPLAVKAATSFLLKISTTSQILDLIFCKPQISGSIDGVV